MLDTQAPADWYVTYGGRTMLRARGGDDTEEETPVEPADPSTEDTSSEADAETVDAQRYKELQADHTRKSQRLSELEETFSSLTDPEQQAEALRRLGIELEEDSDDEDEFDDPYDELKAEVDNLKSQLDERNQSEQQQAQVEAEDAHISQEIDRIASDLGEQFSDEEVEFIGYTALGRRKDDGAPDVEWAVKRLFGKEESIIANRRKNWTQTKKAARPGSGSTATDKFDPTDPKQRQARLAQLAEEADAGV